MEQYSVLAKYYDMLTDNVEYEKWAEFYVECFERFGKDVKNVVDIGCGTGNMTVLLAERGYEMTGVDISSEMLCLAQKKAETLGLHVRFAEQDMSCLDTGTEADAVCCSLDGINYLLGTDRILSCFCHVAKTLGKNGLFIFDVNTPYKFKNILGGNAFVYELDDLFLSWQSFFNEKSGMCDHFLTFFAEHGGVWHRYDEQQRQRSYSMKTIERLLKEAGLSVLGKYADTSFSEVGQDDDRCFFVCGKA